MAGINYDKLVKLVKGDGEITQAAAAKSLGVTTGQLSQLVFQQAKVEAGVFKKAPGTPASVKKLRDNEGNRWELIAARTGLSVAAVKSAYEEAGGNPSASYIGKGRNFNGGGKPASGKGNKPSGRSTGGKPAGRSTGKPAGRSTGRAGNKPAGRSTGRRSTAGNPS